MLREEVMELTIRMKNVCSEDWRPESDGFSVSSLLIGVGNLKNSWISRIVLWDDIDMAKCKQEGQLGSLFLKRSSLQLKNIIWLLIENLWHWFRFSKDFVATLEDHIWKYQE